MKIKNLFLVLVVFACAAGAASAQSGTKWTQYSSAERGFSVSFPGVPKETSSMQDTAVGRVTTLSVEFQTAAAFYTVAYTKFPAAPNPKTALDGARDGMLSNVKGSKLVSERDITVSGRTGRDFTISIAPTGLSGRSRIFVIGDSLIQAVVISDNAKTTVSGRADIERFLNSLKLTGVR